ncbi:MAG TPA: RNA polymerase sigma factor, partial [Gaiellaceae bacterium]|nr:RNA polymerase sigma factor [Gaiellaceae bacterium]
MRGGRRRLNCPHRPGGTTIAAEPAIGRADIAAPPPAAAHVEELYARHAARVLAFCRSRLRTREDAEDAAQTTFLLAQRALARGVEPRAEATWLVTIAQNVCLNRGRDARRMRAHEHPREPEELERLAGADAPEPVDLEELKLAVQELPEQQRRAILLREWQGCTYAEIEQELGLGKAHVETLIFRGRRALAQRLEGRLRSLDAASLLSFCKTGFGGVGAAKLAGCAAAVAVCVGSGIAVERLVRAPEAPSRPPVSSVPVPEAERRVQAPGTAPARATVAPEPRTRAATAPSAAGPAASRAGRGADRVAPT